MTTALDEQLARDVVRITHQGLGLDELRLALDETVRGRIGWDLAAWSTIDPATLLFTSCVLIGKEEDHEVEARLFDSEFRVPDVNSFVSLTRTQPRAATLQAATDGDPSRSPRWRSILAPLGITDELRAVFVDGVNCWGTFVGYRVGGGLFTPSDVSALDHIGALVADGLRRALLFTAIDRVESGAGGSGIAVVESDGSLSDVTPQAVWWLEQIAQSGATPSVLRSIAAAARAASNGDSTRPAHARLARRGGGWIMVHGSVLAHSGKVAVVIEAATEHHLADVLVRAYGLTAREREVTELVLRGESTAAIAAAMFISPHTVQDHVKAVLAKAGASSRRDLVATLHGRHYAPQTAAGVLPSPYGWYR